MNARVADPSDARRLHITRRGAWLMLRQPVRALARHTASQLLRMTGCLPRPLRYARTPEGIVLCGEWPLTDGDDEISNTKNQLLHLVEGESRDRGVPDSALIAEALVEIGELTQRDDDWIISPSERWPTELRLRAVQGGVDVRTMLIDVPSDAEEAVRRAVAEFLCLAQASLRFSRVEFDGTAACVSTQVATEDLDSLLPIGVEEVAAGWRRLVREAKALADPILARAYLQTVIGAPAPATTDPEVH